MMKVKTQPPFPPPEGPSFTFQIEFFCMKVCGTYIMKRQGRDGQKKVIKVKVKAQREIAVELSICIGKLSSSIFFED